jgi:hypothetical protein
VQDKYTKVARAGQYRSVSRGTAAGGKKFLQSIHEMILLCVGINAIRFSFTSQPPVPQLYQQRFAPGDEMMTARKSLRDEGLTVQIRKDIIGLFIGAA